MQKPLILSHKLIVKIPPIVSSSVGAFPGRFRGKGRKTRNTKSSSCDKTGLENAQLFQFKDYVATRACLTTSLKNHPENTAFRFIQDPPYLI